MLAFTFRLVQVYKYDLTSLAAESVHDSSPEAVSAAYSPSKIGAEGMGWMYEPVTITTRGVFIFARRGIMQLDYFLYAFPSTHSSIFNILTNHVGILSHSPRTCLHPPASNLMTGILSQINLTLSHHVTLLSLLDLFWRWLLICQTTWNLSKLRLMWIPIFQV